MITNVLKISLATAVIILLIAFRVFDTNPVIATIVFLASLSYIIALFIPKINTNPNEFKHKNVKIIFDELNKTINFIFPDRSKQISSLNLSIKYQVLKETISQPKIGSGMLNGQIITFRTGDIISFDQETGYTRITVVSSDEIVGVFDLPNDDVVDFKYFVTHVSKVSSEALKEQLEKQRIEADARREKLEKERLDNRVLSASKAKKNMDNFILKTSSTEPFYSYNHLHSNGDLLWALVADRNGVGGAIYEEGKSEWIGSWSGANVNIVNSGLEIMVDDIKYRNDFLKERRFIIPISDSKLLNEWSDRIKILSKK